MTDIVELCKALRAYQQADMDGVMVLVSRQACDEGADEIERQRAEIERLRKALQYAVERFAGHALHDDAEACRRMLNEQSTPQSFAEAKRERDDGWIK